MTKHLKSIVRGLFKNEAGQSIIFVAVGMVMLLGISAFTVDAGYLYHQKRQLQNTADAAALAAASELKFQYNSSYTATTAKNKADTTAREYVSDHNLNENIMAPLVFDNDLDPREVTVRLESQEGLFLSRALGYQNSTVVNSAKAGVIVRTSEHPLSDLWADESFSFSGSNIHLDDVTAHCNGDLTYNATISGEGSITASGTASTGSYDPSQVTVQSGVAPWWPTFDFEAFIEGFEDAGGTHTATVTPGGSGSRQIVIDNNGYNSMGTPGGGQPIRNITFNEPGLLHVQGDLDLTGAVVTIQGPGYILVDGDISLSASFLDASGGDETELFIISRYGDIHFAASGVDLNMRGLLYAPEGDISNNNSYFNLDGYMWAKTIGSSSGGAFRVFQNSNVDYGSEFTFEYLGVRLLE